MKFDSIYTGPVTEYSDEVAAGIGRLMPMLDETFSSQPTPRPRLEKIISSPYHDQLVAVRDGQIVGAATMSLIMGAGFGERGQLEDFVVNKEIQGQGIGKDIWNAMGTWCTNNVFDCATREFGFETEEYRPDAVNFYLKRGAVIIPQTYHLRAEVPVES